MKRTPADEGLIETLRSIVGRRHILTGTRRTERYRKGFRSGEGDALAVVFPGSLLEQWDILQACVATDAVIIMQAANTGLTEGSTPTAGDYGRPVVIINTLRMDRIDLIDGGRQIISFPGGTLFKLEAMLKPLGRQPHSVIGSSCIGASIVGGISNNSGGALIKRGPAYTELALYARVDERGILQLVNNLGISLGSSPEEILGRLDRKEYGPEHVRHDGLAASDGGYADRIRDVDADSPARFNADVRCLREASGSAGKLSIFAVRLDTFAVEGPEQIFYIGTEEPEVLTHIRRHILSSFEELPVAGEYIHRDAFDITRRYGKDTFLMIDKLGTGMMPRFFALKGRIDATLNKVPFLPKNLADRILQAAADIWPEVLPRRLVEYRDRYSHHLMLKMSGKGVEEASTFLNWYFEQNEQSARGGWFLCTEDEGRKAFLHRFAAAGAAIRYATVSNQAEDMVALDIALPRNAKQWAEMLPQALQDKCLTRLYYGHFFCHVFHQDYVIRKGVDPQTCKDELLAHIEARGAEYPAEHNVGHIYKAKPALADFYKTLDPTNTFNPGVGKMSKFKFFCCDCDAENRAAAELASATGRLR
jgi:D-lactate dehydrogenase